MLSMPGPLRTVWLLWIKVEIRGLEHLEYIMNKIRKLKMYGSKTSNTDLKKGMEIVSFTARVKEAKVQVMGRTVGQIEKGLVVLLGVTHDDTKEDLDYLVEKTLNLRIFPDDKGKMNRSLLDVGGELLVVSQFTLYGYCRKGRRPSFIKAAPPPLARKMYEEFINAVRQKGVRVSSGRFQEEMLVEIYNEGPVTILLDSKQ